MQFFLGCDIIHTCRKSHGGGIMDRRVQRTKKAIRSAFLTLMLEKDIDKITIKEIAERADVDRKTVYNYYTGVYDILGEVENELVASFEKEAQGLIGASDPKEYFATIARLINKDMELYELIMRSDNSTYVNKIVAFLRDWIETALNESGWLNPKKIAMTAEYVTGGIYCAYRHWFHSDRKKSLEEFSLELCELVMGGLPAYFLKG